MNEETQEIIDKFVEEMEERVENLELLVSKGSECRYNTYTRDARQPRVVHHETRGPHRYEIHIRQPYVIKAHDRVDLINNDRKPIVEDK